MFRKRKQIKQAVEVLRNGGAVVFPTETSYGLAADATNLEAVERLMKIKGRGTKTLPLIVGDLKMAQRLVEFSESALRLAKRYWPGPLTMVLSVRSDFSANLLASSQTGTSSLRSTLSPHCVEDGQVAIRISSHPVARKLSQRLDGPIVATSANRSDQPDCYSVEQIKEQYQGYQEPDYFIDVGELLQAAPSTVIKLDRDQIKVLRQGEIKL